MRNLILLLLALLVAAQSGCPGSCTKGCYKNNRCCSSRCATTCNEDGNCGTDAGDTPALYCEVGYYGRTCAYRCPSKCADPICLNSGYCTGYNANPADSSPATQCQIGLYGASCAYFCPSKCANPVCLVSGQCQDWQGAGTDPADQCQPGYYGSTCAYRCHQCSSGICSKDGGCVGYPGAPSELATQCVEGSYGSSCSYLCPKNCALKACTKSGTCFGSDLCAEPAPASHCATGFYGSTCAYYCPSNCATPGCTVKGMCIGYQSVSADSPATQCKPGFYGSSCSYRCPSSCATGCLNNGKCPGSTGGQLSAVELPSDSPASPQCSIAVPFSPACVTPDGSTCSFYSDCLAASHPCDGSGYAQTFGLPMCEKFLQASASGLYDPATNAWMAGVRKCLQQAAVSFVYNSTLSCDEVSEAAFASHVPCYTAPGNNLCFQSPTTMRVLMKQVLPALGKAPWGVLKNAMTVSSYCVSTYQEIAASTVTGWAKTFQSKTSLVLGDNGLTFAEKAAYAMKMLNYYWSFPNKGSSNTQKRSLKAEAANDDEPTSFADIATESLLQLSHFAGNFSLAVNSSELSTWSLGVAGQLACTSCWNIDATTGKITWENDGSLDLTVALNLMEADCLTGFENCSAAILSLFNQIPKSTTISEKLQAQAFRVVPNHNEESQDPLPVRWILFGVGGVVALASLIGVAAVLLTRRRQGYVALGPS